MQTDSTDYTAVRFPDRNSKIDGELFIRGQEKLPLFMKQMGYTSLRPGQEKIVVSIMTRRDTIGILPTSVGKSATFILPTMALGWRTLIFSPLTALMRDQVQKLNNQFGFPAGQMSGPQGPAMNIEAAKMWISGALNFFYVAPERMKNVWFQNAMKAVPPDMIVIDEAHCISEWGEDFRYDYTHIGDYVREHPPKVVLALTATCTPEIEADIRRVLGMANANKVMHYTPRPNLKLHSSTLTDLSEISALIDKHRGDGTALVYCSTINPSASNGVVQVANYLQMTMQQEIGVYHGDLSDSKKPQILDDFMSGRLPILVATNAFGMGVDKGDIRVLIHHDIPGSIESLSQEVGRAGRDWKDSYCHTFFTRKGLSTQEFFLRMKFATEEDIRRLHQTLNHLKSSDSVVRTDYATMSKLSGVKPQFLGACIQSMFAASVIQSARSDVSMHTFRFLNAPDESHVQYVNFEILREVVNRFGAKDTASGNFTIEDGALMSAFPVTKPTVKKYLKQLRDFGFIFYKEPIGGAQYRVLGGMERMDFPRLAARVQLGAERLRYVVRYTNEIADVDKQAFLKEYFEHPVI